MKQEAGRKNKKWIWIVAIIAVLVIAAGTVAAIFLLPQGENPAASESTDIYWNIDREIYTQDMEVGLSTRVPAEDGLYHIRFVTKGQVVQYATGDIQLVNYIDSMQAMSLVLDADGMIADAINAKMFATEIAKEFSVKKVEGNYITLNSSAAMNGLNITITLSDTTSLVDVRPDSENIGQPIELQTMDTVWAYGDEENNVTDIFMTERAKESKLYLRTDRFYANKETTRVPDENGVYTIPFAVDGELVQLKCKSKDLVTEIDMGADSGAHMGLIFDEEGYIIEKISANIALRGTMLCDQYNITAIEGNRYTVTRLMPTGKTGEQLSFTLTDDTFICMSDVGCGHSFPGAKLDALQLTDRIICYTDGDGNAIYIDVARRSVEGVPMYYQPSRKWDSVNKVSSREPNEQGYYVFEFYGNGKYAEYKTKDKKLADQIDSHVNRMMGLDVDGSIIKRVYDPTCVSTWGVGTIDTVVYQEMGSIIATGSGIGFDFHSQNWVVAADAEISVATGDYSHQQGAATTLRLGDWVYAYKNINGEMSHAFVTARYEEGTKLYYNTDRRFNNTRKVTNRTPDEDGYYVYEMICEGKTLTVKTKDKKMADFIDMQNSPFIAMRVTSAGIVKNAYQSRSAFLYGKKVANFNFVSNLNLKEGTFDTYYRSNGEVFQNKVGLKMAENCKVYNVSTNFEKYRGEKTTLRNGDQIQGFATAENNEIVEIYVMKRRVDSPIYWPYDRHYNGATGETTRTPDANGYYNIKLFADGKIVTVKTKDKALASEIDSKSTGFTLRIKNGVAEKLLSFNMSNDFYMSTPYGWYAVKEIKGQTVTLINTDPSSAEYGQEGQFTLAKDHKTYDVSNSAKVFGQKSKIQVGDWLKVYIQENNEANLCFIVRKHTREAGHYAYCDHCDKKVYWVPFQGNFGTVDGHYYLQTDSSYTTKFIGYEKVPEGKKQYDVVFDLNGKTLTTIGSRNFVVYSNLTIIDSAGGGIMEADGAGGLGGNVLVVGGTLNVKGGTIRSTANATASTEGGNICTSANSTINIYGGTLEGGKADLGNAIRVRRNSVLNIYGGKITGDISVAADSKLILNGKLDLNTGSAGIDLTDGAIADISKLSADSKIKVMASGIFTTERDDIATLGTKKTFVPARTGDNIIMDGKALRYTLDIPSVTENLSFMPGTQKAVCPVCQKMVTWTPIDQETYGDKAPTRMQNGSHYYLTENVTNTGTVNSEGEDQRGFFFAPETDKSGNPYVACVHFNGHNLTVKDNRAAFGSSGIINFMGEGTVSGNFTNANDANDGSTMGINTSGEYGALNLYSGTYVKNAGNTQRALFSNNGNGGRIRVFKDAKVIAPAGDYGIYVKGANLSSGYVLVEGAVTGNIYVSNSGEKTSAFELSGKVEGAITFDAGVDFNITGAPVVTGAGIDLTNGVKLKLDNMTGGNVTVLANGVFTDTKGKGANYQGYFTPAAGCTAINLNNGELCTELTPEYVIAQKKAFGANVQTQAAAIAADIKAGDTVSDCPMCGAKNVTWVKKTGAIGKVTSDTHVYYTGQVDFTTYNITQALNGETICILLADAQITTTGRFHVGTESSLNIMGTGKITSNGKLLSEVDPANANQHDFGLFTVNGNTSATVNLYGGEYCYTGSSYSVDNGPAATEPKAALLGISKATSVVNIFNDVIVGNKTADYTKAYYNVYLLGTLNMYGGTICNGLSDQTKFSGNVTVAGGTLNMYGGTISGGRAPTGGNICISANNSTVNINDGATVTGGIASVSGGNIGSVQCKNVKVTINGGEISRGTANGTGGNDGGGNIFLYATLDRNVLLTINGGTISNGVATSGGGNIAVRRGVQVTVGENAVVTNGTADVKGGNFFIVDNCKLTTSGTISNGTAGNSVRGGNIDANTSCEIIVNGGEISGGVAGGTVNRVIRLENVTMTMTGGTVKAAGDVGSGIKMVFESKLYLKNGAQVVATDGTADGGEVICEGTNSKLVIDPAWTGKASVAFQNVMVTVGDSIPAARGYVGTPTAQNAAGTFAGTLKLVDGSNANVLGTLTGVNGALKLG